MFRNTVVIAAVLVELSIAGFAQEALPGEQVLTTRSELERTYLPHDIHLQSGPLGEAFDSVLLTTRRPGGAVFTYGCGEPAQIPVFIPSTYSLANAFDLLTAVYPTHDWAVRDGVINLLPKQTFPAVLDTLVERIAWDTNEAVSLSIDRVFGLSTVKRRLVELGLSGEIIIPGLQRPPRVGVPLPKGREWKIENVTLLGALNRIAASYGDVRWVYEERHCETVKTYRVWAH
jgi:hypothetical protein